MVFAGEGWERWVCIMLGHSVLLGGSVRERLTRMVSHCEPYGQSHPRTIKADGVLGTHKMYVENSGRI